MQIEGQHVFIDTVVNCQNRQPCRGCQRVGMDNHFTLVKTHSFGLKLAGEEIHPAVRVCTAIEQKKIRAVC